MKRILPLVAILALTGQGCFAPAPAPAPIQPEPAPVQTPPATPPPSSEQNMPPVQPTPTPPPASQSSTYNEIIQNFAFSPKEIQVKKGDKIIVQNRDSAPHSMTADKGAFDSGLLSQGKSFTLDTSKLAAGRYPFHCSVHPSMTGVLVVN